MKMLLCVLVVAATAAAAFAAEEKAATEPTPVMAPEKLGPRTEAVDEKAYAKVLHVAPSGADHATIAQALAAITDAAEGKRYAIFVAAGEYKGDTVEMKPFVDLFGGFDAGGWKRDIDANRTILDGEGQRRVVVGADHARIDGFTIRNGKVRGHGGGILCVRVSLTISNNRIISNATLAPEDLKTIKPKTLYLQQGSEGGGIAVRDGSSATITNNIIADNTTEIGVGGGIVVANSSMPRIANNVIVNNTTGLADASQTRSDSGGGISVSHATTHGASHMAIVNNVVANNKANGTSDAGGIFCEYDSDPVIGANWILGNWAADDGSAIYVMKLSQPLITGNIVAGHSNHGAIRLSKQGTADIEDNVIFANSNALTSVSAWMSLKNNTIVDNASGVGHHNSYAPYFKPPVVVGNVIYNNGGGQFGSENTGEDAPIVKNNDIQGGYKSGEGNFDEKPQFIDDGAKSAVKSVQYDQDHGVTTIATDLDGGDKLAGRVVSLGDKWGVIKQAGEGKIVIWGDLRSDKQKPDTITLAPTYRLKTALAHGVGAQASR